MNNHTFVAHSSDANGDQLSGRSKDLNRVSGTFPETLAVRPGRVQYLELKTP